MSDIVSQVDGFAQQHPITDRTRRALQKYAESMRVLSSYDYIHNKVHVCVSDSTTKEEQEDMTFMTWGVTIKPGFPEIKEREA